MNTSLHIQNKPSRSTQTQHPRSPSASQFARELGTTQTEVLNSDRRRVSNYLRGAVAGLAMLVAGYAQNSEAGIMLSENNVQGEYSLVNDVSQPGYNIMGTIRWWNDSDPVPANNQISANGTFGTNQGLYKIDTDDDTHDRNPPTYDIDKPESFNIQYADGVVNTPNDSDTFKFYFNLGPSVTSESQAQTIVDNLNAMISGQTTFTQDQPFLYKRDINGLVNGDGVFHDEFENSPSVYVIPEPVTITSLLVGMGALLGIKKFKEKKL